MRSPHEGPYVWNRNNVEHATNPSQQNLVNRKQQVMRDRESGTEARLQWLEAGVAATPLRGTAAAGCSRCGCGLPAEPPLSVPELPPTSTVRPRREVAKQKRREKPAAEGVRSRSKKGARSLRPRACRGPPTASSGGTVGVSRVPAITGAPAQRREEKHIEKPPSETEKIEKPPSDREAEPEKIEKPPSDRKAEPSRTSSATAANDVDKHVLAGATHATRMHAF